MTSLSGMAPGSSGREIAAAMAKRETAIDIIVENSYWESARPQPESGGDCSGSEAELRSLEFLDTASLKSAALHGGLASSSGSAAGPVQLRSSPSTASCSKLESSGNDIDGDFDIDEVRA